MGDFDSERAQAAWRRAGDADVILALKHVTDYSPAVQGLLRAEAQRRGVSAESEMPVTYPSLRLLVRWMRRRGVLSPSWIQRHPYGSAAILGLVFPFIALVGYRFVIASIWLYFIFYCVLLLYISWRQRRYLIVCGMAYLACVMNQVYVLTLSVSHLQGLDPSQPSSVLKAAISALFYDVGVLGTVFSLLLCGTVYVRKRCWPLIIPGRCRVCDYDLRGLPEPRCPECGTPFDPAEAREAPEAPSGMDQKTG